MSAGDPSGREPAGEVVGDGPRVRFTAEYAGPRPTHLEAEAADLARAVTRLDALGLCPPLDDGLAAGNGALAVDGGLLVTPSGRRPGACDPREIVLVTAFDPARWCARYLAEREGRLPTSDTPLHWAALVEAPRGWPRAPRAALHGHALASERDAARLGLPLTAERTRFSTPEDRAALLSMLGQFPYPANTVWIRRDHGFFVLGDHLPSARERVETLARAARALERE